MNQIQYKVTVKKSFIVKVGGRYTSGMCMRLFIERDMFIECHALTKTIWFQFDEHQ